MKITAGSRDSALAVAQSEIVLGLLRRATPGLETELVTMKTTGDMILDRTLDKVGGKGLFVKELDRALLAGEVDITIHSLKDIPMQLPLGIEIAAAAPRGAAEDVLVLPKGVTVFDGRGRIGCASRRRAAQAAKLFPDAEIKPVRGNVITRIAKLDSGEYDALILAKAGLERLGLDGRISRVFTPKEMIPAAGQGIIAAECRTGFSMPIGADDEISRICAAAERAFTAERGGGCSSPAAAYCTVCGDEIELIGMDVIGGEIVRGHIEGKAENAAVLGREMARRLG